MTTFQLMATASFAVIVVLAYRAELLAVVRRFAPKVSPSAPDDSRAMAETIVDDLVFVTELRDKLAAEDSVDGVDACTALLRVLVEHIPSAKFK